MNIKWVPDKKINVRHVHTLFQECEKTAQFTNYGPNVKLLEQLIRSYLKIDNSKAIICTSNGTTALHAGVSGINIYHNRKLEWATQSFTFPSSAQAILNDVKIVDIDQSGGLDLNNIDPISIDGIIVTNIFGNIVDINRYTEWCKLHNKLLLFDNAATPYTFYKGQNALNYGDGSIISFHHTKPIGFGEGGAIIIEKKYEYDIRRCLNFGIDNDTIDPKWHPYGSNYKMSDISAIYIIQYFDNFERLVEIHRKHYTDFAQLISEYSIDIKFFPNHSDSIPFVSCFCLLSPCFTKEKVSELLQKGIYCRKYYTPLVDTPNARTIYNNIICLPCTVDMTYDDLVYIASSL